MWSCFIKDIGIVNLDYCIIPEVVVTCTRLFYITIMCVIFQVTCNSKSSFLAAADDSGEVKVCLAFIIVVRCNFLLCNTNTTFIDSYEYIFFPLITCKRSKSHS